MHGTITSFIIFLYYSGLHSQANLYATFETQTKVQNWDFKIVIYQNLHLEPYNFGNLKGKIMSDETDFFFWNLL